jgi:hypothetical protein
MADTHTLGDCLELEARADSNLSGGVCVCLLSFVRSSRSPYCRRGAVRPSKMFGDSFDAAEAKNGKFRALDE